MMKLSYAYVSNDVSGEDYRDLLLLYRIFQGYRGGGSGYLKTDHIQVTGDKLLNTRFSGCYAP